MTGSTPDGHDRAMVPNNGDAITASTDQPRARCLREQGALDLWGGTQCAAY